MAIRGELAGNLAEQPSSWQVMADDDDYRKQITMLVKLGMSQKVLAREMGVGQTWFGRWLANRDGRRRFLNNPMMNRFAQYLVLLLATIQADAGTPLTAEAVSFMDAVKQIDAAHRPMATRILQRIVRRQSPSGAAPVQAPRQATPSTPQIREKPRGLRVTSRAKAATPKRRRPA